ncbi:THAP domain-containing protein 5-like [Centropristis striata]|uniref:THAP domain-containing protein 5-like n=1 Tax=Centropristis striata TaxID=184440 RepID=UPI0027E1FCE7|nr:THAP domain-containing protein 5-like [Centropristis striata]
MPRYCAVKVCRNRGGSSSRQDNKRISFYPFPLQDRSRLQRWVDNMQREEWTPSRHQYLCSEHFTEDCFDIRWGIRYLKNTAVPTVFPSAQDDEEKKVSSMKRSPKARAGTSDTDTDSPLSTRPLILSRTCKKVESSRANRTDDQHTELIFEAPLASDTVFSCQSDLSETQTPAAETPGDSGGPPASCLTLSPCDEAPSEDSVVTLLCCESLGPFSDGEDRVDAALGQAFGFVSVEMVKDEPTACFLEERPGEGEHTSVYEHSYCRPDTDRDQLWRKILSLHAKILELDRREESTVAKIRALESEVALLKRDGAVFKEKQKVLEGYISSMVL